tara:strand:- start:335 stop:598 length:264 start_codon:yes stop_codon:yes gene_type:complete
MVPGNVQVAVATPVPPGPAVPLEPFVLIKLTVSPGSPKYAEGVTTGVKLVTVTVKTSGIIGGPGLQITAVQTLGVQTTGFITMLGVG